MNPKKMFEIVLIWKKNIYKGENNDNGNYKKMQCIAEWSESNLNYSFYFYFSSKITKKNV